MTPDPTQRKASGLLFVVSAAALIAVGVALALALSHGSDHGEAGPGLGVLPTAPVSTPATGARSAATADGSWPVGATGYTVVIATLAKKDHPRASAVRLAHTVQAPGLVAHVLDSSKHPRLRPDVWIVYVGRYPTRAKAAQAARRLRSAGTRHGVVERLTG